jgi:hypothetical protein
MPGALLLGFHNELRNNTGRKSLFPAVNQASA